MGYIRAKVHSESQTVIGAIITLGLLVQGLGFRGLGFSGIGFNCKGFREFRGLRFKSRGKRMTSKYS